MLILITNLHSALNLGDDAIMVGTLAGLEQRYPGAQIVLSAGDPDSWRKFEQVEVVSSLCNWVADCRLGNWGRSVIRAPFFAIVLAIAIVLYRLLHIRLPLIHAERRRLLNAYFDADLVLSCGGGVFYAHHSPNPAIFMSLMTVAVPLLMGKPVMTLPQSFGPIEGRIERTLSRLIFRRLSLIMVRERGSRQFLLETFSLKRPVAVVPDLAFYKPANGEPAALESSQPSRSLRVGLTAMDRGAQLKRFSNQANYEDSLVLSLAELHQRRGIQAHIFVQCYGPSADHNDTQISRRICARLQQANIPVAFHGDYHRSQEVRDGLAQMDCVIATRMHTGIFALSNSVPVVMIAYQPKAKGLMSLFGLDDCLDIATVDDVQLSTALERAIANRPMLTRQIAAVYADMTAQLAEWVDLLAEEL